MTIGERIKAKRKELKLSQRELSDRMGYSNHSTIARIEAGKVDLPQSRIAQFAEVLGVSTGYLMGWDQEPEDLADVAAKVLTDPDLLRMVEQYLALSEVDRYVARVTVTGLYSKHDKQKKTDASGVSQEVEKVSLLETE